jgi:hypothetical protein
MLNGFGNKSGSAIISQALGSFETVKANLAKGVELCSQRAKTNDEDLARAQEEFNKLEADIANENEVLTTDAQKANQAIIRINKLLTGE